MSRYTFIQISKKFHLLHVYNIILSLVCRKAIDELEIIINEVDPKKNAEVKCLIYFIRYYLYRATRYCDSIRLI